MNELSSNEEGDGDASKEMHQSQLVEISLHETLSKSSASCEEQVVASLVIPSATVTSVVLQLEVCKETLKKRITEHSKCTGRESRRGNSSGRAKSRGRACYHRRGDGECKTLFQFKIF